MELVRKLLNLPGYFTPLLIKKYGKQEKKLSKQELQAYWKETHYKPVQKRAFQLLLSDKSKKHLAMDDFKSILRSVMDNHPGLEFLRESPEFQDFYAQCVINRMFYMANRRNDYQMSYREFKNSNILKSLYDIEADP